MRIVYTGNGLPYFIEAEGSEARHILDLLDAESDGRLMTLRVKQYQTIYYISDSMIYIGWYLTKMENGMHLIINDKVEMKLFQVSDNYLFLTREEAEAALRGEGGATREKHIAIGGLHKG